MRRLARRLGQHAEEQKKLEIAKTGVKSEAGDGAQDERSQLSDTEQAKLASMEDEAMRKAHESKEEEDVRKAVEASLTPTKTTGKAGAAAESVSGSAMKKIAGGDDDDTLDTSAGADSSVSEQDRESPGWVRGDAGSPGASPSF